MYKSIDELVERIDERNSDGKISTLIGVSIDKCFINSVANINGTDLTKYKIIRRDDFAVSLMQVSRDSKIPIARLKDYDQAIMSPAYPIFRVRDTSVILPEYLEMWFMRPEFDREAAFIAVGGVRGSMPWEEFAKMRLPVPSLEKQHQVVRAYQIVADRIAIKRRINDNLQKQAAALFANFYDQAETEVGFTEMIQILGGGTPKTGESSYWNGDIPFFTPKDVGFPYTLTTEKTITEEGLAHCNSRLYPINTVFVTARGTVGKVGLPGVPMAMNQSCYALVGKDTHQLLVYFYTLKAVDRLKHKASGAVFDAITTRDFEAENIMKLSDDDTKAFLDVAEPIYQAVLNNSIENLRLAELRDSLLPKLMNGEIDVSGIQL